MVSHLRPMAHMASDGRDATDFLVGVAPSSVSSSGAATPAGTHHQNAAATSYHARRGGGRRTQRGRAVKTGQSMDLRGAADMVRNEAVFGNTVFGELLLKVYEQHQTELAIARAEGYNDEDTEDGLENEIRIDPRAQAMGHRQSTDSETRRCSKTSGRVKRKSIKSGVGVNLNVPMGDESAGHTENRVATHDSERRLQVPTDPGNMYKAQSSHHEDFEDAPRFSAPRYSVSTFNQPAQLAEANNIEPLPVWKENHTFVTTARRSLSRNKLMDVREVGERLVYGGSKDAWISRLILSPCSLKRLCWDVFGFTILSYDLVNIPFTSAFSPVMSGFSWTMNWVSLVFWNIDMLASLMTGYHKGVQIIMDPRKIFINYLQTWFVADLLLVMLDWYMVVGYEEYDSTLRQGRGLRLFRYIRALRLLRMMKLKKILTEIQFHINTELLSTFFAIVKTITVLVACNHLIACAWFAIGTSDYDLTENWVVKNALLNRSVTYQYVTSLHWSLTQFTPASMEIRPYNSIERTFSVIILLVALVAFSSFLSTLTALMTVLTSMRGAEVRQFWMLRRYLKDLKISRELSMRVQRYCEYTMERRQRRIGERDVTLLAYVSDPLRDELKAETHAPFLAVHPLLEHLEGHLRYFINAVTSVELARHDTVFCYGERGTRMLIVNQGELEYSMGEGDEPEVDSKGCSRMNSTPLETQETKKTSHAYVTSLLNFKSKNSSPRSVLNGFGSFGSTKSSPSMKSLAEKLAEKLESEVAAGGDNSCHSSLPSVPSVPSVPENANSYESNLTNEPPCVKEMVDDDTDSDLSSPSLMGDTLFERDWVAEPALWTRWDHLGYLDALSECQLLSIDSHKFGEAIRCHQTSLLVAQRYAKELITAMNKMERSTLSDVIDRDLVFATFANVRRYEKEVNSKKGSMLTKAASATVPLPTWYAWPSARRSVKIEFPDPPPSPAPPATIS